MEKVVFFDFGIHSYLVYVLNVGVLPDLQGSGNTEPQHSMVSGAEVFKKLFQSRYAFQQAAFIADGVAPA